MTDPQSSGPLVPITASVEERPIPTEPQRVSNTSVLQAERQVIEEFTEVTSRYSGPVPPPEMLSKYNEAYPGCAQALVEMAREEAQHRHAMERVAHETEQDAQRCENELARERVGAVVGVEV